MKGQKVKGGTERRNTQKEESMVVMRFQGEGDLK